MSEKEKGKKPEAKKEGKADAGKEGAGKKGKGKEKEEEIDPEDQALMDELELLVTRCRDPEAGLRRAALDKMRDQVRTSASSMTAVPKPLKFLRPHYATLKETHAAAADAETKTALADVIALLARSPPPAPLPLASGRREQRQHTTLDRAAPRAGDDVRGRG